MRPAAHDSPAGRARGSVRARRAVVAIAACAAFGAPAAGARAEQPISLALGDRGGLVEELQRELAELGQRIDVDGQFGPRTRGAVRRAQGALGLPATGLADHRLMDELRAAPPAAGACPAPEAASGGGLLRAFPVGGTDYRYTDDYGASRGQGGHGGIDILAARGTPVLAVADGTLARLSRTEAGLGGISIWLEDASGNTYYYAHLDAIRAGLKPGAVVTTGQPIGTVGNTGDARFGAPHLHFEIHPGGGGAVNGYPALRAVDAKAGGGEPTPPDACEARPPAGAGEEEHPAPEPREGGTPASAGDPAAPAAPRAGARPRPVGALATGQPTPGQLRINERIARAALGRVNQVRARLGGSRVAIPAAPAGAPRTPHRQLLVNRRIAQLALRHARSLEGLFSEEPLKNDAPAAPARAGEIAFSVQQLMISQRIAQEAIRRVNALLDRLPRRAARAEPGPEPGSPAAEDRPRVPTGGATGSSPAAQAGGAGPSAAG